MIHSTISLIDGWSSFNGPGYRIRILKEGNRTRRSLAVIEDATWSIAWAPHRPGTPSKPLRC